MKKVLLIVLAGCWAFSPLWAQFNESVTNVGTSAAEFLQIGVGARAMAMGGSYVAIANDPTALFYNPAGIVWSDRIQIEFMHNEWLVDTDYDFIGATLPLPFGNSSIGVSFIMLNAIKDQPVRTSERPQGTGEFYNAASYAVGLTYASALTDRFSFGLSGKYINETIYNTSGGTMALDVGVFYTTPVQGLNLGMSIANFGGNLSLSGRDLDSTVDPDEDNENIDRIPVSFQTSSFPLPQIFRAGISYAMDLGRAGSFMVTSDVLSPSSAPESVNFGAEYGYAGMFFLRGGVENSFEDESINGLTLGGGIDYSRPGSLGVRVDYAWSDWGILQDAHRFSIGVSF